MTRAVRIKIEHPQSLFLGERKREIFWDTLAVRAGSDETPNRVWQRARQIVELKREQVVSEGSRAGDDAESYYNRWEAEIRNKFCRELEPILIDQLYSRTRTRRYTELVNIKFGLINLEYGSLELVLGAFGLDRAAVITGVTMPIMMAMIEESVPVALRHTLDLPRDIRFNVSISEEDALDAPVADTSTLPTEAGSSRAARAEQALTRLMASYVGSILLALAVLYFAASAALDAMKGASTERLTLMQGYADLTKQQLINLSDERKEVAKAAQDISKAATDMLHDANADRTALVEALRKIATDENRQSIEKLQQAVETVRQSVGK